MLERLQSLNGARFSNLVPKQAEVPPLPSSQRPNSEKGYFRKLIKRKRQPQLATVTKGRVINRLPFLDSGVKL